MFFKMRSAYSVAALSAVLTVAAVASAAYKVEAPKLTVTTTAGLKMLKISIVGTSSLLKVEETDTTVKFITFLNSIDTGNRDRNGHMLKRFGKKPELDKDGKPKKDDKGEEKFRDCSQVTLSVPKDKIGKGGTIPGTFTFHCTSQPVDVKYTVDGDHVTASFTVKTRDHGDKESWCTAANTVCVAEQANVEVDMKVKH